MESLPILEDDGLVTPVVGEWGEEKYQLVRCYAEVFATAMKRLWECRVYIDLFAGSGRARLSDSQRIVPASPLLVLGIRDPFDRYVFCDIDSEKLLALRKRVEREFPEQDVEFVDGDANAGVAEIIEKIPQYSRTYRVLTFCFVDPFNINNLKFDTLRTLAARNRRIDFLVLIPSGMDAQRNWNRENNLYEEFLGNREWRSEWTKKQAENRSFASFFVDEFANSMQKIGFQWNGLQSTRKFKNEKNSTIYHLAFFSREAIAAKFWDDCKKYTSTQHEFGFMRQGHLCQTTHSSSGRTLPGIRFAGARRSAPGARTVTHLLSLNDSAAFPVILTSKDSIYGSCMKNWKSRSDGGGPGAFS